MVKKERDLFFEGEVVLITKIVVRLKRTAFENIEFIVWPYPLISLYGYEHTFGSKLHTSVVVVNLSG